MLIEVEQDNTFVATGIPVPQYPRRPRIIGLTGLQRSGKDTAAAALRSFGYKRIGLADPLKAMLATLLAYRGMTQEDIAAALYGDAREQPLSALNGATARYALRSLGTEWGRDLIHPSLWLQSMLDAIDNAPERRFVVSDVRFDNEAMEIIRRGGIVIHIHRPGNLRCGTHSSEKGVHEAYVHHWLINDDDNASAFQARVRDFYTLEYGR